MVRWRRCRLISSDCVDFGISYFGSDFVEKIIEDQDECEEPYISIPFDSSSVLEFVRSKEKISAEVREIRALLGVDNDDVNGDIEIEKVVINNNNDVVSFRRASFCDNDVPPAECGSEIQINTASLESMVILTYEEELEECDIDEAEEEEIGDMKGEEDAEDINQEQEEGDICEKSSDGNEDHDESDDSTGLSEEESIAADIVDALISRVLDNCMIDMNLRALRIQALETLERKKLDQLRELELAKERKRLKRKQKKKARLERKQNDKKTEVDYRDKLQDEKTNIEGDLRYKLQEKSKRDLRTFLNRKK